MRVEERPVMTLPQFWLAPLEYLLDDTTGAGALDAPKLIDEAPPPALRPRAYDIFFGVWVGVGREGDEGAKETRK